jgi:hypothetical protein
LAKILQICQTLAKPFARAAGGFANAWQKSPNFAKHWQTRLKAQAGARVAEHPQGNVPPALSAMNRKKLVRTPEWRFPTRRRIEGAVPCVEIRQQSWGTSGQVRARNFGIQHT